MKLTTKEDVENLVEYIKKNGGIVIMDSNPSPEKLSKLKAGITAREEKAKIMVARFRAQIDSQKKAKELLKIAYEKGEFDEVIHHLEQAKKLKHDSYIPIPDEFI